MRIDNLVNADVALAPAALNSSNATGPWLNMANFRQALFVLVVGALAATKAAVLQLVQATDETGSDVKDITGKTVTLTAHSGVQTVTLTSGSVQATQKVTVNGVVFEAVASGPTGNQYVVGGTDAANATALGAAIAAALPELIVGVSNAVVTLIARDGATVTVTSPAATITVATTRAQAFVWCGAEDLDTNAGFTHVAAKVTTDGNCVCSVVALRAEGRYGVNQGGALDE